MSNNNDNKIEKTLRETLDRSKELLQRGKFDPAAELAREILTEHPDNGEALYLLAVCQRFQGRLEEALNTLAQLKRLRPGYGRAFQEEGHVCKAAGHSSSAIRAYRHAVSLNNSLIASWKSLTELLLAKGETEKAKQTQQEFEKLNALPKILLSVRNMIAEGYLFKAERLCRKFLKANKTHVEGMRLLADLGVKADVLDDAEFILEKALEFEPDNNLARNDYMEVLYRRQKYEQSLAQAQILREREPKNLKYQIGYANQAVAVGDYETALRIYDEANKKLPSNAELRLVHGHALKTIGKLKPAIDAYRKSFMARNDYGDAYWSLANLKTYRFTNDEISLMTQAEAAPSTKLSDRVHLCFALGKHYEDNKSYETSFSFYDRGNVLRKSEMNYTPEQMTKILGLQKEHCQKELFTTKLNSGSKKSDPIFVVGLPRAGSTLLEQIIASHSQVDGTLELPNIPALAYRLAGRRTISEIPEYPENLHDLDADQLEEFGEAYIKDTRIHRKEAPYFIDKMPNNFRHIGLIHLILPNAKIIDARRGPMACCFSGFKQLFASGQQFTYGLQEIGTYYRNYVALMDHWDKVLPEKILRVQYEDVVEDLSTQVHRILDFCSLPYEEACINFHKTERNVRTPSSEQVRQPIYKSGLEQWKHYEPWLDPLKEALGKLSKQ